MASLEALIKAKQPQSEEENLESGRLYSFSEGNTYTKFCKCSCWCPQGNGTAVIEVWGAGGSGAKMCCCGNGLPGNSGSYSKTTKVMTPSDYMYGCTGFACGNSDALCFRGCSEPTMVCMVAASGNSCMCARGGKGGVSYCSTGTSMYCCFRAGGFCHTNTGPNCGTICNQCSGQWDAIAYGGDVNRCGNISCMGFHGCYPACVCLFRGMVAFPPGMITECGGIVQYGMSDDSSHSRWSGMGQFEANAMINGAGRSPGEGLTWKACYQGDTSCGCYNTNGCQSTLPYGVGGPGPQPCPGVRDHATRGGMGAIRIKFVES
jgi:hypothetical protein